MGNRVLLVGSAMEHRKVCLKDQKLVLSGAGHESQSHYLADQGNEQNGQ